MRGWAEASLNEAIDLLARWGRSDLASDLNRIMTKIDFDDLEVLRCVGSDRIADEILEADSIPTLVRLLGRLAAAIEVKHCTLHVISEAASSSFATKVLTTYPAEWVTRYVNRRYSTLDPVTHAALETNHGFYWDTLDRTAPTLQFFWQDSVAYGIGPSGYTQPITTERGDRLAVSVCSPEEPDPFRGRIERHEADIFSLGIFLTDAFSRLASEDRPTSFNPTDDQLMILRGIAMGRSEQELRERSYRYGSYATLERSICSLFRTRTVAQAAVMAARLGLLADAPLTTAEILVSSDGNEGAVAPSGGVPMRRLVRLRYSPQASDPEQGSGSVLRLHP
jgi:hypothetical protein